jgi:hypothetical protein
VDARSDPATIDEIKAAIKALTPEEQAFIEVQSFYLTKSIRRYRPNAAKDLREEVALRLYSGRRYWYPASIANFSYFYYSEMRSIADQWRKEVRLELRHDRSSDYASEEAFESALRKSGVQASATPEQIALDGSMYDELARREADVPDRQVVISALRTHRLRFLSDLPEVTGLSEARCEAAVVAIRRQLIKMHKEGWFDRG